MSTVLEDGQQQDCLTKQRRDWPTSIEQIDTKYNFFLCINDIAQYHMHAYLAISMHTNTGYLYFFVF